MNGAVLNAVAEDQGLSVPPPPDRRDTLRQFDAAMRLACLLARPVDFLNDAHCRIGMMDAARLRALAGHPAFRGSVNRALATTSQTGAEAISQETVSRLATSPELRLAALVLTAPLHETRSVALMLVAAVLSRRICGVILKSERNAIQEALGVSSFHIAIHEAPLLYPLLASLDRTPADWLLFRSGEPLDDRQHCAAGLGYQLIGRFFDGAAPEFATMYGRRLPPDVHYADRPNIAGEFNPAHCAQFIRLIRRRQRAWSDIIG